MQCYKDIFFFGKGECRKRNKKAVPFKGTAFNTFASNFLLSKSKLFNDSTISFDISIFQVVK
jgi:hypothetical protein